MASFTLWSSINHGALRRKKACLSGYLFGWSWDCRSIVALRLPAFCTELLSNGVKKQSVVVRLARRPSIWYALKYTTFFPSLSLQWEYLHPLAPSIGQTCFFEDSGALVSRPSHTILGKACVILREIIGWPQEIHLSRIELHSGLSREQGHLSNQSGFFTSLE